VLRGNFLKTTFYKLCGHITPSLPATESETKSNSPPSPRGVGNSGHPRALRQKVHPKRRHAICRKVTGLAMT